MTEQEHSFSPEREPEKAAQEKEWDVEHSAEKERGFDLSFYVTDHSPDHPETGSPEKLRALYEDIKRDGIQSVRYDWHWKKVEPKAGEYDEAQLDRYAQAKDIMHEVGLNAPTIILSNPPKWAVELYKKDKEGFYRSFEAYVSQVRDELAASAGEKVSTVQVLNELNVKMYTPVSTEDLPRMCEIVRRVFAEYNPDTKLLATTAASNLGRFAGTPIKKYLEEFEKIRDSFDVIAVDCYPGLWHLNPRGAKSLKPKEIFKRMVAQTDLLKEAFETIAAWDMEYELGETGISSHGPWGSEESQRYFYDAFFRAFKHMLVDFRARGLRLPARIGLYEAIDEPPQTTTGKLLRKTPYPEHDLGMRKADGDRKLLLEGGLYFPEEERATRPSQLSKIIDYLRAPMRDVSDAGAEREG